MFLNRNGCIEYCVHNMCEFVVLLCSRFIQQFSYSIVHIVVSS